jgi:hypothetical protein
MSTYSTLEELGDGDGHQALEGIVVLSSPEID